MKKFISLVLALVMALSLTTVAWGADPVAKIGTTEYDSLAAAVTAATAGDEIVLLKDVADGVGIVIDKKLTIDFGGYTYTFASNPVGSTGTESQGFQILKAANAVTLKNGTLTSKAGSGVKMLVNNYCDLTLDGMTLIGTNLDDATQGKYVLSNNAGDVVIEDTTITAAADGVAFDSYDYSAGGYTTPPTVTVKGTSVVTGEVVSDGGALVVEAGTFNGEITVTDAADVTVKGGTFTDDVSAYVAAGSSFVNGKVVKTTAAGNTTTYDVKNLTVTAPNGSDVPTTGITKLVKVDSVTNTTTVNGKTTTTFVPAWYQIETAGGVETYVECDKSVATFQFTIKGVGSVYVRYMNVPAAFDATPVALYTAPKTATCGKVGANEDTYVVVDGKYYATEYTVVPGAESYALVNGKMVVYYGEASAKGHNWLQATKESYDTKTGVITSVKCPDCKGVVAVYAKPGSFDGKEYVKITEGVATNYYYVAGTVATFTGTTTGTTTGGTVTSAETFDAGIAMYVGMSVMAAAGSAVVLKKKD